MLLHLQVAPADLRGLLALKKNENDNIFNNLNMTKIESRPIFEKNWEYRFFIDFEGNLLDSAVRNALCGIEEEASWLRIIGNY